MLAGCIVLGVAGANTAGTAVSGTVTKLADGAPLQGALVIVAGPHQPPITATTGADGSFSIAPTGDGPYGVGVSAAGFKSRALSGVSAGSLDTIPLEPATYIPLPVYAGTGRETVADAHTGVFYSMMAAAPEVYRTLDYGGSWQAVTPSYDDPTNGLAGVNDNDAIAISGVSGEVAVVTEHDCTSGNITFKAFFSTDYGLTWRRLYGDSYNGDCSMPNIMRPHLHLFWGHASVGAPDVLLFAQNLGDGSWNVWRADMSVADPKFAMESSDPFGTGSVIAVADSASGSFIGRVNAAGALSFAPLTASGPITFGADEVTGLPSPPQFLRLGGVKEASSPPDGALIAGSSSPFKAVMITKNAGAVSFSGASVSATTNLPDSGSDKCVSQASTLQGGSIVPTSTGSEAAGNVEMCWLEKSGTGPLTIFHGESGQGGQSNYAFDANYGQPGNLVSFLDLTKNTWLDANGVPVSGIGNMATAGTTKESGGRSIQGIMSPQVNDSAYGPVSGELAVASDVSVASKDGGKTMTESVPQSMGSSSVQWWQGASGEWLLFGSGGGWNMLSAAHDWNGTSAITEMNVGNSTAADFNGPPVNYWDTGGYGIDSLAAVPGTDTVFIGVGIWGEDKYESGNHIYRARLTTTDPPTLTDIKKLDPNPSLATVYMPRAMAYCPASSGFAGIRDTLFVTGAEMIAWSSSPMKGSLLRISGATSDSPTTALVTSVPHDSDWTDLYDVRADCNSGVVYAGGGSGPTKNYTPLYKSVDGGQTFTPITIRQPDGTTLGGWITAIGLNPTDANDVTIAVNDSGSVYHSADGGTNWTLVRDRTVDRSVQINDIEFAPGASTPTILSAIKAARTIGVRKATVIPSKLTLVATNSGVFTGDLRASTGLIAVNPPAAGAPITALGSDSHPALASAATDGAAWAVFHRSNGLYLSAETKNRWSSPEQIPKTTGVDDFPTLAFTPNDKLYLTFARAKQAAGIYVMTMSSSGAWSSPRRVTTGAGDTLPVIAISKSSPQIAFLRTLGSKRGVYYVSSKGKKWSQAARVRGSKANDGNPTLGGPTLYATKNKLQLAFTRQGHGAGIYMTTLQESRWSKPARLSRVSKDSHPALVIDSKGVTHIVFNRIQGRGDHGLFELQGKLQSKSKTKNMTWSLRHIPKTTAVDREPALFLNWYTLGLTFVRSSGSARGVYYDQSTRSRRWRRQPQRWSANPNDQDPAIASNDLGQITVVFERS
ncbi:MAG: carboxypeptidase-like regulatory domain-containing protein [Gaiellaceae bacterium]